MSDVPSSYDPSEVLREDGTLDLDAMKDHLGRDLQQLLGRHDKIRSHLHNTDREMPGDWQEAAQLVENDEVLEALEETARERIEGLRNALRRIATGHYTTCVRCGDDINPRRLAAIPVTTLCVRCAAQG